MSELTSRDYKGAGRHTNPPSGGLKEFLLGALAGGLLAGFGTALVMHHLHRSTTARAAAAPAAASHTQAPASSGRPTTGPEPSVRPTPSRAAAGAPGAHAGSSPATDQPQYDFYQMLPNLKVTVPAPTAPGARSVGPNGRTEFAGYVLQVGAYRDEGQARRVVAYLDSIGILAHIDTVHAGASGLYRVRIGPIIERSELKHFRAVLKRVGYPGVLIPGATH